MRSRKLLWLGSPFFSGALSDCGWEVRVHNFEEIAVFAWEDLVRLAGWEPDVLVVADKSRPPFVLGMEAFPCLTLFYAVDTHIHSWYPWYAQGFDACLVSLRDHLPLFGPAGAGGKARLTPELVRWFPAFAPDLPTPAESPAATPASEPVPREWDCLFVGTVDPERTPRRQKFMDELGRRLPVVLKRGDYRALYPRARVVLNYCELGDLNFRVFEALGCGACLVTPRVDHGLSDLFCEETHFLAYEPDNLDAAEAAIRRALGDAELRAALASQGLEAVNAAHRAAHRARAFTSFVLSLPPSLPQRRQAEAANIRRDWLRPIYLLEAEALKSPLLREAYLDAARGLFRQR